MTNVIADAAQSGDGRSAAEADFETLFTPMRSEIMAHCYRMLGSAHDADDAVQETYLRAWRAFSDFEGRSSIRTWLYRIATNVCLTALEGRGRRAMPSGLGQERSDPRATLEERHEIPWLEPVPDAWLPREDDPATVATGKSSVRLALIAALQHLPPKQRAALLMKEVLQWQSSEIADALGSTTASVNSSLQRARAQLDKLSPREEDFAEPAESDKRQLLDRYARALEQKDIATIVQLFTADAVWEMPPFTGWYQGPADIGALIDTQCPAGPGELATVPLRGNGQPAFGVYILTPEGTWEAFQLQVLDISGGGIRHAATFFDLALFGAFGLSQTLSTEELAKLRASP
ncbi:sigma-70 family RNA polymerase sigma factor [Hoyosella subflava]|uniref:Putative RNA polymerase ECF-type sigma factor SigG n=1 Tax=Hoyosella subflava (strain DSM 45089 / JCM 17490 / NBRC 109087 / DQS3-9A1) TaxID=443218 RepID=F6EGB1_HOYSD|nr:sigma-70 family RNA polymerase sigma factor [Hoyosella subflava]AEF39836.1 Putative RNA polymerase ECF-type sigma factor SigG [Hoyosella subflava DQS3-9A1]